jgi:cobalt-zinc-cadmium efflux system outer membrane protein
VAAAQVLELRRTVAEAAAAASEMADRMRAAGTLAELDAAAQQAMSEQAKLDVAAAEAEVAEAHERLSALMGVWGEQTQWRVPARLPEPPAGDAKPPQDLEALAIKQRADLAAGREAVAAAGAALGLTAQSRLLPELQLGADTERDPDGKRVTGPTVSVPIPLFDTGGAALARQRALLHESQQRYEALAVQARSDVRRAREHMLAARQRAEFYRKTLLPLRHRITEQTQLQYNAMLVGVFQLVQAKQAEIAVGREYIEALRDHWLARTELERALGGRLEAAHE